MSGQGSDFDSLTSTSDPTAAGVPPGRPPAQRRDRGRLVAAGIVGAIITLFAVLNFDQVRVHWLITTGHTPLIVVIAFAFLLGVIVDRLAVRARRKRQQ